MTVEDPVEYSLPGIQQVQVHEAIGLTFARVLRGVLRHDPNVILVGEIRDEETAEIAARAAQVGRMVLSTLHTNDAAGGITRLMDMGVDDYLLTSTINGILAQRLVRTLCVHCKVADGEIQDAIWETLVEDWGIPKPQTVYRPVGCPECRQTGFLGRTGLYELLTVTLPFSKLITENADIHALRAQSIKDEMKPLRIAGAYKIVEGLTTADEILKVTSSLI